MNCEQARTEIIAYLKGELDKDKKKRLEEHLIRCPNCRHEVEGARRLLTWTEAASQEAIVSCVEEIIDNAIKGSASDIHFEVANDNSLVVRYRIDGVMQEAARLDSVQRYGVITRVKMMADMDVEETRIPQDGRIMWKLDDREYDLRAHCCPFFFGESIVLRILDKSSVMVDLERLGFSKDHLEAIDRMIRLPSGMFLTGGPSGSGKTTTLYSILLRLNAPECKIMTIEDPVEYLIRGANQAQVNKRIGFTSAMALRSFTRQDPDVIMAGEIRDAETASLLMQAAITGHFVLSQLHTNDAIGVIQRLRDMGIEDVLISGSLVGVEAQRLVRKPCKECAKPVDVKPSDPLMTYFGITAADIKKGGIMRGEGCKACRNTGYKHRIGVYEVLEVDRGLREMIGAGASMADILEAALAKGFKTTKDDARDKILAGQTTPEEAFRVLA